LREITAMKFDSKVFGLCRLLKKDVDLAVECGIENIGLIVLANDQYLKAYNWTLDQVMQMISETSKYARGKGLFVTLMIAEASRMETERFVSLVNAAAENGYIDSVSAMDTFGVFSPTGVKRFVKEILAKITVPLELHCHNDFGLAVANSIAAIESGVKTIHCSVLGLGERIGNAPTEELVASLEMLYGIKTGVRLEKLRELAEVVSKYSGIPILSTKPVIGSGLNTIVSGLVAAEYIRLTEADKEWEKWLFPFLPHVVGLDTPNIVLGKTSGNANLDWNLSKTGLKLTTEQKKALLEKVKEISSSEHRLIDPAELAGLV
jgi:isopropylmalate/homocitrate/citramalate synthase